MNPPVVSLFVVADDFGYADDQPVIQLDAHATALAAAGVSVNPDRRLDGVDLLPYLSGEKAGQPHDALYWRFGEQTAIGGCFGRLGQRKPRLRPVASRGRRQRRRPPRRGGDRVAGQGGRHGPGGSRISPTRSAGRRRTARSASASRETASWPRPTSG